jgi:hypothetical protein
MRTIYLLKMWQGGWTCPPVMGFLRRRGRANGRLNGSRQSTVRPQVVAAHNDVLSRPAPGNRGCEIGFSSLEDRSGEAAGQRGLMNLWRLQRHRRGRSSGACHYSILPARLPCGKGTLTPNHPILALNHQRIALPYNGNTRRTALQLSKPPRLAEAVWPLPALGISATIAAREENR